MQIIFTEFQNRNFYIHAVSEEEKEIRELIHKASDIMEKNVIGPILYLTPVYDKYMHIVEGKLLAEMKAFFKMDPFPYLKVRKNLKITPNK